MFSGEPQIGHRAALLCYGHKGAQLLSPRKIVFAAIVFFGAFFAGHAIAQEKSIVVASTTSTQDSGLFDYLLPLFTQKSGIAVKVLAQGTGQALDAGRHGEADVVLVHNKSSENRFIDEGDGVKRVPVMYNDFVLIGPKSDPAGIRDLKDVAKAFEAIKAKSATFISRGDRSGTHLAELRIWSQGRWHRYRERPGLLVHIDRPRYGRCAPDGGRQKRLCAVRPRHMDPPQEQG